MNHLIRITAVSVASIIVCATLGIGVWWMFSALPQPADLHDEPHPPSMPNDIPPPARIPWQRNPDALQQVALSPAWFPWQRPPARIRRANGGWTPPPSLPRMPIEPAEINDLTAALKSPDGAAQDRAITRIEQIIRNAPLEAARQLANPAQPWAAALIASRRWTDLDHLASELLVPLAYNTDLLESLLFERFSAAADHPDVALIRCRQWFSISSLHTTAHVIALAEQVLRRANPNNKRVVQQFRAAMENAAGVDTSGNPPATAATEPAFSMRLDPDDPDSRAFAAAAANLHGEDYSSLIARGNLLLLAGRPGDAQRLFRRAYMLAPDSQLAAAVENFARVIKAQTGSIPATNAWLQERK